MSAKQTVFIGERYGRLLVSEMSEPIKNGKANQRAFVCECDCGSKKIIAAYKLTSGRVKSCGCLVSEKSKDTRARLGGPVRHGHARIGKYSRTYTSWYAMIQRCENENHTAYSNYGGRGITVCKEWHKFDSFLADMGERPKGMTIDRINVNGNYEKANCRWADRFTQAANKRTSI